MEVAKAVQRGARPEEPPLDNLTADERMAVDRLIATDPYFTLVAEAKKHIEAIPDYRAAMATIWRYAPKIYRQLTVGSADQLAEAAAKLPIDEFAVVVQKWVALYERKIGVTRKYMKMSQKGQRKP